MRFFLWIIFGLIVLVDYNLYTNLGKSQSNTQAHQNNNLQPVAPPPLLPPAPSPSPTVSIPPFKGQIREVGEGRVFGDESQAPDGEDNLAAMPYVNNVYPATVRIGGRATTYGSGVSIDPALVGMTKEQGAVVLTCAHVINSDQMRITTRDDKPVAGVQILDVNKELDIAVLTTTEPLPIAPLADKNPPRGTPIWVVGWPITADQGQRMTISPDSVVLGMTNITLQTREGQLGSSPYLALHEGTATEGNSGGPVVGNNQVVGLLEGVSIEEVAIPIETVHKYLQTLRH
jgi:S1-C subfamily serine protease